MDTIAKPATTYEQLIDLFDRSHREFEARQKTFEEQMLETKSYIQQTSEQMRLTDRKLKELGDQIGGLGNKFGIYNEGLFMPSLIRIIENQFHCNFYASNSKYKNNGSSFEIDFWGYSATECYIMEVKTHLKSKVIKQLQNTIEAFRKNFPEHSTKKIFGAVAATSYSEETRKEVLKAGFYFISISDNIAELNLDAGFEAREF